MRVYVRWTSQDSLPANVRLTRFKRVLLAAQQAYGYRKYLRAAGLASPETVISLAAVESVLPLLPITDIGEFRNSPAEFENPGAFPPGPQPLLYPLRFTPRTAVLTHGFQQTKSVKVLQPDWVLLARFRPEAVAAPVGVLRTLALGIDGGRGRLPSLKFAAIAFTGPWPGGLLREEDRELFWRVFQVPVFEQHLGPDGRVVAWECEAHRGLHLLPTRAVVENSAHHQLLVTSLTDLRRPAVRLRTRLAASIADGDCPCGETSPKLLELRNCSGYGARNVSCRQCLSASRVCQ
jgi:hypothetical protein